MPSGSSSTVGGATRAHPSLPVGDNGRAMPILASGKTEVVTAGAAQFLPAFSDTVKAITIRAVGGSIRFVLSDGTVPATAGAGSKFPYVGDGEVHDEPVYADGGGIGGINVPGGQNVISIVAESGAATVYVTERE
ncbi:MAG: hypothetical protein ACR2QF_02975 [Geminicoccaceae bacterium]